MPVLETILLGAAGSSLGGLTKDAAIAAFKYLTANKPGLVAEVEAAAASGDDNRLRTALVGALTIAAGAGAISISNATLEAVRSATIDHQHGSISIGGTTISAPVLVTGGGHGATGQTVIRGGTVMKSAGTSIEIGLGASIEISGNARIEQT